MPSGLSQVCLLLHAYSRKEAVARARDDAVGRRPRAQARPEPSRAVHRVQYRGSEGAGVN